MDSRDSRDSFIVFLSIVVMLLFGFICIKIQNDTDKKDIFMRLCTDHYGYSKCVYIYDNGIDEKGIYES